MGILSFKRLKRRSDALRDGYDSRIVLLTSVYIEQSRNQEWAGMKHSLYSNRMYVSSLADTGRVRTDCPRISPHIVTNSLPRKLRIYVILRKVSDEAELQVLD